MKSVLKGIYAAKDLGVPVKINTVLIRDINDCEINEIVEWALDNGFHLRFIEFMPVGGVPTWSQDKVVTQKEIIQIISRKHLVEEMPITESPAKIFKIDRKFEIGIIPTVSQPFCQYCNRIRITSDGKIFNCLFALFGYDVKKDLRAGNFDFIKETILQAWLNKPEGFIALKDNFSKTRPMHFIGG
jgi:cyclic pyranopterin phosphate synthase